MKFQHRSHRPLIKDRRALVAVTALLLTLGACATQPYAPTPDAPGFLSGLLHGFLGWFALVAHIFSPEIRVYAYPNGGGWYDFGFLLGLTAWGGVAAAAGD
ncbi:MAG: hypothetical protein ACKOD3_13650 [Phenylobacterium sp.]